VKILITTVLIALAALQQPGGRGSKPVDLENAYRANNRGVALLEQFNYDGAATAFRDALKVSPDLAIARANLAIALFYASKNQEAADAARAAVTALPESPTTHYVAGLIAKADNRLDEAAAAFERVLQLDRDDAGAKVQLGQIRTQERKYDEAIPLFQQALSAEPYNVTAAYSVALALTRAGRADEGRQAMQRFDTLRSSAYGVTYAQTYLSQGHYAEALTSTGSERSLVNASTPAVSFSEAPAEFLSSKPSASSAPGGIALVDVDNDGDLDIVTNEFNAKPMLLVSNLSERKQIHYLTVKLRGTTSNRDALGAVVKVTAGGKTYTKVLDGSTGYLSHGVYPLYFGLGSAESVDSVDVTWPSGKKQKSGPVRVNDLLTLAEQ
jgi:cytochrome c-type biogenesis protein CcmH/NrfG